MVAVALRGSLVGLLAEQARVRGEMGGTHEEVTGECRNAKHRLRPTAGAQAALARAGVGEYGVMRLDQSR